MTCTIRRRLTNYNFSILELPTIKHESEAEEYIEQTVLTFIVEYDVERDFPGYAHESGRDIISELRDELSECRDNIRLTHSIKDFNSCVHQHVEDAKSSMWELTKDLIPPSSRAGSLRLGTILIVLIFGLSLW